MNESQRKQFIKYFRKRLESLDFCDARFENALSEERQGLVDYVNRGDLAAEDPELNEAFSKIDWLILPTFRNCMIVAVCTLLEETLHRIGMLTIPDFDSHVRQLSQMSKIKKYLHVLETNAPLDLTPVNSSVEIITDVILVRNAITHAWGKIDNCTNSQKLRDIISRRSWLQESGDNYIVLDDQAYADAVEPVLDIVQHIINELPVSQ